MRVSRQYWPRPAGGSGNANGNRRRNPDHAVEHLSGYGAFTLLGRQPAGAQLRSDDRLVSADRGFRETAPAVAGRFLPGHAALLCDDPNVAIALALRLGVLCARHRRGTWWDNDIRRWIGLVAGDGLVHRLAIIGTVRHHGGNLALDRLEQRRHLTGVIGSIVGQDAGDDLAGAGIHGEVQLAPGSARPAVLLLIPLALAEQLQASAVDHQVQRAVRDDLGLPPGKAAAAAAERGMVGNTQLLPEQPKHG